MLAFHFRRELRSLWFTPPRRAAVAVYVFLCLWALASGLSWQSQVETILAETPADLLTDRDQWFEDLRKAEGAEEVSPYAARPMALTIMAQHHPQALAALAFREESMQPHATLISGWRSEASLFRRYEVEGPSALWVGRLDLAFVVVAFLPLFLLMLSFDALSRERESGRLALFLVQGGTGMHLVYARVLAMALPLFVMPTLMVLLAALTNKASLGATLLWIAAIGAYTCFWVGVACAIAVLFRKTSAAALAVLAAWAFLVVVLPSGSQFVAQAVYPTPSRVAYLTEAREAEGLARRNVAQRADVYMAEHPGQGDASDEAVPGFYRSAFLANVDINERTAPMISELEAMQAAQRRLVSRVAYLSPALLTQNAMRAASGTGSEPSAAFRQQARAYLRNLLETIGPATVNKSRLSLDEAEAIPDFVFSAPGGRGTAALNLLWILALGLLLAIWVHKRGKESPS